MRTVGGFDKKPSSPNVVGSSPLGSRADVAVDGKDKEGEKGWSAALPYQPELIY